MPLLKNLWGKASCAFPEEQALTPVMPFGAVGNSEELLPLHDEMCQGAGRYGEPLRQAIRTIARGDATTHD